MQRLYSPLCKVGSAGSGSQCVIRASWTKLSWGDYLNAFEGLLVKQVPVAADNAFGATGQPVFADIYPIGKSLLDGSNYNDAMGGSNLGLKPLPRQSLLG